MPEKIIVTYIYHSCYTVEIGDFFIIFDYFKGPLKIPVGKQVIFISSHSHHDHYTSEILKLPNMKENIYILSQDIADLDQEDNIIFVKNNKINIEDLKSIYTSRNIHILGSDKTSDIRLRDGKILKVRTFGSTDKGFSILLDLEGINIFHAGDLNFRARPSNDAETMKKEYDDFMREVEKIKNYQVDLAFFPVDYRLEENFDKGGEIFIKEIRPQLFFPMHSGGHEEVYFKFAKKYEREETVIGQIYRPNQEITIEIENSL